MAMLLSPVVRRLPALMPIAMLLEPVVLARRLLTPSAVFPMPLPVPVGAFALSAW